MALLVERHSNGAPGPSNRSFLPALPQRPGPVVEDERLHEQQQQLAQILESAPSFDEAQRLLQSSLLAHTDWKIDQWEPHMLETALSIAQKWRKPPATPPPASAAPGK